MSISLKESYSISQFSQASHKSFANQGLIDKISFKSINDFFLFPFYDELLQMVKLNSFFSFCLIIILLAQAFKTFANFTRNEISDFFTDFYFSETYETVALPFFYFLFDIIYFIYVIRQYRTKRMFNYWQLYLSSVILSFFNVIFFMPVCGVCGHSVIRLNQIISSHYSTPILYPNYSENRSQPLYINNIYSNNLTNYRNKYNNIRLSKEFKNVNYQFKRKKDFFFKKNKYKSNDYMKRSTDESNYIKNSNLNKIAFNENKNIRLINGSNIIYHNKDIKEIPFIQSGNIDSFDNRDPVYIYLFNTDVSKYTFSLILTLIEATIHSIQIIYNFHFISDSPYLDRTIFGMWDSKVFASYVLLIGINKFITSLLTIFPIWCTIVYHISVIFGDIYILYYTIFQPFIKVLMNCFFQSLLTYNMISNVILVLYNFKLFSNYRSITPLVFVMIIPFFIIYYFINKKIISVVNKKLSPQIILDDQDSVDETNFSDEILLRSSNNIFKGKNENQHFLQMTDDEKREMFDKYVFQSIEHALLYLRVGVSSLSPYFTDFSFLRYMKDTYGQLPIQLFILRLISFFPSEHQYLNYGIALLAKREDFMNAYEQFIMYQLHRINIVRQSNVSKELQSELASLDKMSDESISAIRSFWIEIFQSKMDFEVSSLRYIRKMTLNTKSCYIDALEKFPNSTQLLNSYCRFLCEGCGDYIECVRIGQKIKLIEQGKHVNADFCFHAFVNVFPDYLKKGILNEKGNFIQESNSSISSQLSAAISSGQISASFDNISGLQSMNTSVSSDSNKGYNYSMVNRRRNKVDLDNLIEQENFETLISTLFSNGKSKLIIQQIVERSRNIPLIISLIIAVAQTVCFLAVILIEIGFVNDYKSPIDLLESTARISKIVFSFQYCSFLAGIQYLSETHHSNISDNIINLLNIRDENLPQSPCTFINPLISLNSMTESIVDLIDEEMKFILSNPTEHSEELKIYAQLDYSDMLDPLYGNDSINLINLDWEKGVRIYKLTGEGHNNYSWYRMTLRSALEYFSAVVDRLAYEHALETIQSFLNKSNITNPDLLLEDQNQTNATTNQFIKTYFELLINGLTISEPFAHLFRTISKNGIQLIKANENTLIVTILVITIIGPILFISVRIYCFLKLRELMKLQAMAIKKVKNEDIVELMKPIYLKSQRVIKIHSTSNHSIYESSSVLVFYGFASFIPIFILFGFFMATSLQFKTAFEFVKNAQQLENDAASRFLYLTMMINYMISNHLDLIKSNYSDELHKNSMNLLNLTQNLDLSIIGKWKDLKQFYFMVSEDAEIKAMKKENILFPFKKSILSFEEENEFEPRNLKCTELDNSNLSTRMNIATYLDCISIESKVNLGIQYYHVLEKTKKTDILIDSPEFLTELFILDKYLYQDLPKFQDVISSTASSEVKKEKNNSLIVGVIGMAFSIIFFIVEILVLKQINFSFDAFKQLIMVLPPSSFSSNSFLVNFLIGSFKCKNPFLSKIEGIHSNSLSEEEILVNAVNEGVVNTDQNLIIQSVNPAIQKMTGFLPDQLLGQTLLYLIPRKSRFEEENNSIEKYPFYQRIGEIRGSSGSRIAELNTKVLTDKGQEILVQATVIGMFDKSKRNSQNGAFVNNRKNNLADIFAQNDAENESAKTNDDDDDTASTTSTTIESYAPNRGRQMNMIQNNDDEDEEEFVGITAILRDISHERKLKKDLKKMKRKNEILLNLLLPQPVLEKIRESKKPAYYFSNPATLIKFELDGFDEYAGTMMPKTIMSNLQVIYSKIDSILSKNNNDNQKKNLLCDKEHIQFNPQFPDANQLFSSRFQQRNSIMRFNFNFDLNSHDEPDEDIHIHGLSSINCASSRVLKTQRNDNEEENVENDENCDFGCIYNIRNDNDQFISVAGLFDSQNELKKQAESCLRYAIKVKKIIENIGLEEQVNMFIHTRIAVCMGGPVYGFVDDPENPQIEIFTDLIDEADRIRNHGDLDVVYINENVYNNIDRNKFEIEEAFINTPLLNDKGESEESFLKVYAVHKCLKVKNNDSIFAVSSDSDN